MYRLLRPLLFTLPPETAHAVALATLRSAHRLHLVRAPPTTTAPVVLMGLSFPNRLGVAAGLDKNATCIDALGALGFGFVEVGTVTPQPQSGNARPRLFRLTQDSALINRMGFPSDGAAVVGARLARRLFGGICGVNIGKNAATPMERAVDDYVVCLRVVYEHADYVAINISSPNTAELRNLQQGVLLKSLLTALVDARSALQAATNRRVPLLVKFTADLTDDELAAAARNAVACDIDGIIVSNTTLCRPSLRSKHKHEVGGLSGAPLFERAVRAVQCVRAAIGWQLPLIGVGGIEMAAQAVAMRAAGADLVQIYTGLVYRGPRLVREILRSPAIA